MMTTQEKKEAGMPQETGKDAEVIEVRNLHKSFGKNQVLQGVDLSVRKGENLVVLGKSGSGKSVLIKCMVGLVIPDEGSIRLLGEQVIGISGKQLNALRVKIGFLFQGAALYDSMTVRQNLEFPLRRHRKELSRAELLEKTEEALENVGLREAVNKMPSELSGGMKKRIGLARTLILDPDIILYDEPTTGLDTITSKEISELIREMQERKKVTSIIITHDMACARHTGDRITVLRDGKIASEGSYEQLEQSEDEWIRSLFSY